MAVKIGDVDLANEIIELHFQLRKTQHLLEDVITNITKEYKTTILNQSDIQNAEDKALKFVQEKFPNMGIHKK